MHLLRPTIPRGGAVDRDDPRLMVLILLYGYTIGACFVRGGSRMKCTDDVVLLRLAAGAAMASSGDLGAAS